MKNLTIKGPALAMLRVFRFKCTCPCCLLTGEARHFASFHVVCLALRPCCAATACARGSMTCARRCPALCHRGLGPKCF